MIDTIIFNSLMTKYTLTISIKFMKSPKYNNKFILFKLIKMEHFMVFL